MVVAPLPYESSLQHLACSAPMGSHSFWGMCFGAGVDGFKSYIGRVSVLEVWDPSEQLDWQFAVAKGMARRDRECNERIRSGIKCGNFASTDVFA